jgi:O-antigen/teichoic acid export membrane protein
MAARRLTKITAGQRPLQRLMADEWSDPVSRGGLLMMVNTGVTGVLGLVYWTVAAHLYSQAAVGRASALVAMATLLATVGQLNLGGTLVRYLGPARERARPLVLLVYLLACGSALVLTIAVEVAIGLATDHRSDLHLSLLASCLFTASVLATVIFVLQDYVLIGIRRIGWLAVDNGGFGMAKLLLLLALTGAGGWGAVFASWMLPLVATLPLIGWLVFGRLLPREDPRKPLPPVSGETKRQIRRFAAGDAVAGVFAQSWTYALPPIVLATLGSEANARFYAALLWSSTLDLIAANYLTPLVAAAAHDPSSFPRLLLRATRRIYTVLIPPVLVFAVAGGAMLHIYGASYAPAGRTLGLLALACLPRGVMTLYYTVCNVEQRTHHTALVQGIFFVLTIVGSLIFAHDGTTAVAIVVLVVTMGCAVACLPSLARSIRGRAVVG